MVWRGRVYFFAQFLPDHGTARTRLQNRKPTSRMLLSSKHVLLSVQSVEVQRIQCACADKVDDTKSAAEEQESQLPCALSSSFAASIVGNILLLLLHCSGLPAAIQGKRNAEFSPKPEATKRSGIH